MITSIRGTKIIKAKMDVNEAKKYLSSGYIIGAYSSRGILQFVAKDIANISLGSNSNSLRNYQELKPNEFFDKIETLLMQRGEKLDGWWTYFGGSCAEYNDIKEYILFGKGLYSKNLSALKDFK